MSTTPITDRIAKQVADILAARGQALMQVRLPPLDREAVNRYLAPDYRIEERLGRLSLVHVDWDIVVVAITPDMKSTTIAMIADVHKRGMGMGRREEWQRHRDEAAAAKAAGRPAPKVMPPGYSRTRSRPRKTVEADAPASAGPSV